MNQLSILIVMLLFVQNCFGTNELSVDNYLDVLEVTGFNYSEKALSSEVVVNLAREGNFKSYNRDSFNNGEGFLHLMFVVHNYDPQSHFYFGGSLWEDVRLHCKKNGNYVETQVGVNVPAYVRESSYKLTNQSLISLAPVDTIYASINLSKNALKTEVFDFTLSAERIYNYRKHFGDTLLMILLGALLILIVYNGYHYYIERNLSYLFYLIASISLIAIWNTIQGNLYTIFYPSNPEIDFYAMVCFPMVYTMAVCLFTQSYLGTKAKSLVIHHLLNGTVGLNVVMMLVVFIGDFSLELSTGIWYCAGTSLFITLIVVVIWSFRRGEKETRLWQWGILINSIAILNFIWWDMKVLPDTLLSAHSVALGNFIEMLCFSVAIANKTSRIKHERDEALKRYHELIEQSKVSENTDLQFIILNSTGLRLDYANITMIEASRNYVKIFTLEHSDPIVERDTFGNFVSKLPKDTFTQIHRSYCINKNAIAQIYSKNSLRLVDGNDLPISRTYAGNL